MKKHLLQFALPIALCLTLLSGCGDAASSSSENSVPSSASSAPSISISSKATAVSSEQEAVPSVGSANATFLKTVPGKSDAYNEAVEAFDEFLLGKKATTTSYGDEYFVKVYHPLDEDSRSEDIDTFALMDVTGDGIPELHTRSSAYYSIYSYQNNEINGVFDTNTLHGPVYLLENGMMFTTHATTGTIYTFTTFAADGTNTDLWFLDDQKNDQIVCIYGSGTNYMNGNIYMLEDGSMFSYRSTTGTFYTFTTFAADGSTTELSFSCYEPNDSYEFDGEYMTKEEWDALTKDYFAASEKPASMEWYNYSSVALLDVMNSEKPFIAQNGSEILLRNYRVSNGEQTSALKIKAYAFMGLSLNSPGDLMLKCSTDIAEHDVYMLLRLDTDDKKVYRYPLNVTAKMEIKANGTLMKITDESWKEIFELALAKNSKTALAFVPIASQVGDFYQISDVPVTKNLIDTYFSKWQEKSDVEWLTDYLPE